MTVPTTPEARRRRRLQEELVDDGVPLPLEGPLGEIVLDELDHARHPEVHEGALPRYGALVLQDGAELWAGAKVAPDVLRLDPDGLELGRRLADGRSSFVLRYGAGSAKLVFFDRSLESESSLVEVHRGSGAIVVQRTGAGLVRAVGPDGIVTWDTARWTFKPLAAHYAPPVRRLVPDADPTVLDGLLELCVHWLSAARVGATVVWLLGDVGPEARLGLDLRSATPAPALRVDHRGHFAGLAGAAAQMDRAIVVGAAGQVAHFGVGLRSTERASRLVPPVGGTRHTSARRFSFDDLDTLVFVVSQDGPVTVFRGGAPAAELRVDPCHGANRFDAPAARGDPELARAQRCARCDSCLLIDVVEFSSWAGRPELLACPVCEATFEVDAYRAAVRGVLGDRGGDSGPRRAAGPWRCAPPPG